MTEGTINWGELMAGVAEALQPVPKGAYDVVVSKCDAKTSSTNKSMWAMQMKIEGGPHNGRVIFNNLTLTTDNPQALRMFFVNMHALGLDQQFFMSNPTPTQIANALVGRRARVEIDHRDFQGQKRENVKRLMPASGVFPAGTQVPTMTGPGPGIPGASPIPTPGVPPSPAPTPPVASPGIPAPQPAPAYGTPPAPPAAPPANPSTEASFPIPQPQAPAPAAEPEVEDPSLATPEEEAPAVVLPPGMTQEMYDQFLAYQTTQQQAAPEATSPAADTPPTPPAPPAPPVPPVAF